MKMAWAGALVGIPAFGAVILSAQGPMTLLFVTAVLAIGFGAGLFSHGTLTATMRSAPREHTGMALGAWGAVQATAAGIGVALGGIIRDTIKGWPGYDVAPAMTYIPVFAIEMLFLIFAAFAIYPVLRGKIGRKSKPVFLR